MWSPTEAKNLKTMPQKMPITSMENWKMERGEFNILPMVPVSVLSDIGFLNEFSKMMFFENLDLPK